MEIITITKSDLNEDNEYKKGNIGTYSEHEDVHVEIEANLGWVIFKGLYIKGRIKALAGSGIKAGWGIEAGSGIEAGEGIEAGSGIRAGWGIEAGEGVKAGYGIRCNYGLSFSYKLFAGIAPWTNSATKTVVCGKLEKGTIAYGDLEETGLFQEETDEMTMEEVCKALGKTVKIKK